MDNDAVKNGSEKESALRYRAAGVDLEAAETAKNRIAQAVLGTRTPLSVGEVGAFGGMIRMPTGYRKPVLVMSTDGVGTKVLVAHAAGRYDTVGEDLVNHSVNDILVHGARPLAFQDYIAGAGLGIETQAALVDGVARGCQAHSMALTGGETAQMPGLYQPGHFDLAGTIVGVVEEDRVLPGISMVPGDLLVGYASNGLHTNGYTLARKALLSDLGLQLGDLLEDTEMTVAGALLLVHQSYFAAVSPVTDQVRALAHITGGGIPGNLVRVLPEGMSAVVDPTSWAVPPLFQTIQRGARVSSDEMRSVFNLGVGFIAVTPPAALTAVQQSATTVGVDTWVMGEIRAGDRKVRFVP